MVNHIFHGLISNQHYLEVMYNEKQTEALKIWMFLSAKSIDYYVVFSNKCVESKILKRFRDFLLGTKKETKLCIIYPLINASVL